MHLHIVGGHIVGGYIVGMVHVDAMGGYMRHCSFCPCGYDAPMCVCFVSELTPIDFSGRTLIALFAGFVRERVPRF